MLAWLLGGAALASGWHQERGAAPAGRPHLVPWEHVGSRCEPVGPHLVVGDVLDHQEEEGHLGDACSAVHGAHGSTQSSEHVAVRPARGGRDAPTWWSALRRPCDLQQAHRAAARRLWLCPPGRPAPAPRGGPATAAARCRRARCRPACWRSAAALQQQAPPPAAGSFAPSSVCPSGCPAPLGCAASPGTRACSAAQAAGSPCRRLWVEGEGNGAPHVARGPRFPQMTSSSAQHPPQLVPGGRVPAPRPGALLAPSGGSSPMSAPRRRSAYSSIRGTSFPASTT